LRIGSIPPLTDETFFWYYYRCAFVRYGGIVVSLSELAVPERVVGEREVRRAMALNLLRKIFVAEDDALLQKQRRARGGVKTFVDVIKAAELAGIEIEKVDSRVALGRACAIDRPASVAGLRTRLQSS
jgi:large subunit ribosomal protein L7A